MSGPVYQNQNKKNQKSRIVAILLIIVIVVGSILYGINKKKEANIVETTIDVLTSALDNDDEKYILVEINHEDSRYEYYLQYYNNGDSYFISRTIIDDNEFSFSSVCSENVEYVSSEYTDGFEILNTDNCSNKSYNINSDFAMLDLSTLSSIDFDVDMDGENTVLTMEEEALNSSELFTSYTTDSDVDAKSLVIVSEGSKTVLTVDFTHAVYGESKVQITVEPIMLLPLPEYK